MLALGEARIVEWHVLEQFDIGSQANACVRALDQIVAQQRLGGETVSHGIIEGGEIVDRFAVENRFAE